jgi:predicted nucleic acid-binding protein
VADAVCDAGPLIHLDEVGQLPLLRQFSPLWVPDSVWRETQMARARLPDTAELTLVSPAERLRLRLPRRAKLHAGELDCLALCAKHPGAVFLTDDLDARDTAKKLGIEVHGSVGVVVRAYHTGQLKRPQAERVLRNLGSISSLFITPEIIEIAIEQLD